MRKHPRLLSRLKTLRHRISLWLGKMRHGWRNLVHYLSFRKTGNLIVALVCALVLSIFCYIAENQPYSLLEKSFLYYILEWPFKADGVADNEEACFINISHDRQLVYLDPRDSTSGNIDITDRAKLLQFLQMLERDQVRYKYILMDIRFEKGLSTPIDTQLFRQICRMRDIAVATHTNDAWSDYEIAFDSLQEKAGMSDYAQLGEVRTFSRYTFLQNGKPSLALKMYDDARHQPTSIRRFRHWPLYTSQRHLCTNAPLLAIRGSIYNKMEAPIMEEGPGVIYNFYEDLGADILALEGRNLAEDYKDKYLIIADYEKDMHDTYAGQIPGAYLTWLAFLHLRDGHHILGWFFILLMFLFYAAIFYFLFFINRIACSNWISRKKIRKRILGLLRWLGSCGLLYLVTFIAYKAFSVRYNVTIPILGVTIVNFIINYANNNETKIISSELDSAATA